MLRVAAFGALRTGTTVVTVPTWTTITTTAVTTRAASTITAAAGATITAITTRTITARFARFARRTGVFQFCTGFLIDNAHRQANLAARIDLEDLDLHGHAFGNHVAGAFNPLVLHF